MDDMKTKVESWAESALSLNRNNPDDAIITTITPFMGELNEEVIKRVVEMYNVRNFLDRQRKGEDMEASFPLANSDLVYARLFKDSLKDSIALDEPEDAELPDFTEIKCASFIKMKSLVTFAKRRNEYKDTTGDTLQYELSKCSEFVKKFDEYYSKNDEFIKECRYLYPNSMIIKAAGLDKGPKQIPTCRTITHSEFGTIESMMEKISGKNNQGNQKKNRDKDGIPTKLDINNPKHIALINASGKSAPELQQDIDEANIIKNRKKLNKGVYEPIEQQEEQEFAQVQEAETARERARLLKANPQYAPLPPPTTQQVILEQLKQEKEQRDIADQARQNAEKAKQDAEAEALARSNILRANPSWAPIVPAPGELYEKERRQIYEDTLRKNTEKSLLDNLIGTSTPEQIAYTNIYKQLPATNTSINIVGMTDAQKEELLKYRLADNKTGLELLEEAKKNKEIKTVGTPDTELQHKRKLLDAMSGKEQEDLENTWRLEHPEALEYAKEKLLDKLKKDNLPPSLYSRLKGKALGTAREVSDAYNILKTPFSGVKTLTEDLYGTAKAPLSAANTLVKDIYDNTIPQIFKLLPTYDPEMMSKQINMLNPISKLYELVNNDDIESEYKDNTQKMLDILTYKNNFESVVKNDPALAGADPNILLNIYKTTVSLAPMLMKNKEVVRSILRSANAIGTGGLDPETALTLSKIESNIYTMKNKNLQKYINFGKEES